MHHNLSLLIPPILTKCVLRIEDSSSYATLVPADCPLLEITPPGFTAPFIVSSLTPGFTVNLTACDLGLQTVNCNNFNNDLADGIYIIKYSLSPNITVYVEYNHLRITSALNQYQKLLCCIQRTLDCDPPKETKERLKQAQYIKTLLDMAVAKVEYCHEPEIGNSVLCYVNELLKKALCSCPGCGCD